VVEGVRGSRKCTMSWRTFSRAVNDVASRGRGSADATIYLSQHNGTAQTVNRCNLNNGLGSIFKNVVWATLEDWRPGLDSLPQMHAACRQPNNCLAMMCSKCFTNQILTLARLHEVRRALGHILDCLRSSRAFHVGTHI
jgi:hypothetical protein